MAPDFSSNAFKHLRTGYLPPDNEDDIEDVRASLTHRPRRLRRLPALREMVRETRLSVRQLVQPMFVRPGKGVRTPIASMPGQFQLSIDEAVRECREVLELGIPGVILFGIPESKDEKGSEGYAEDGIIARALREIKAECPELLLWADVCLCEYTSHGHCGILRGEEVANDETVRILSREAVVYAEAGADIIAPSDMMDGRVGAIRRALDAAGHTHVPIASYAVKYASAFYGPFREAAESAPQFGDRRGYQMDPANTDEALREAALDLQEGADMLLVKPALPFLDVLHRVKTAFRVPTVAYNVSGEYAMVHAAAQAGWLDGGAAMMEALLSIRRAGADIIITYHARDAARLLQKAKA